MTESALLHVLSLANSTMEAQVSLKNSFKGSMAEVSIVDIRGDPVDKMKISTWKASHYILGDDPSTISATVPHQEPMGYVVLYMVALVGGGTKPYVSSFGANQFYETDEAERKEQSSSFNWF
ncbi:hypothetical protein CRG98_045083 [Punica granatum]|uniref:Uncharacterized protein n=1 Tax=Punica granatum TaxID=22663 RepID=A0A2I0HTE3_PUNGR|nr:hypothetical protein CRG98_045083 [Punica granatum]